MISIKILAFVYFLALTPIMGGAQTLTGNFPIAANEADYYLTYWATPRDDTSSFPHVVLASSPVLIRVPYCHNDCDSKIYRITKTGKYEYSYRDNVTTVLSKRGFKPITVRTFYLEAARTGIISPEIGYSEFVRMPVEDKQALLNQQEEKPLIKEAFEYAEANLICRTSSEGFQMIIANDEMQAVLSNGPSPPVPGSKMIAIKYLPDFHAPSQLVRLLTDPMNNYRLDGQAYYKNVNSVFQDLSDKLSQY